MQPAKINYKIYQGSTFQESFRWESETKVYQQIVNVSKSAPCVITTQEIPELPIGWRFKVVGVGGMKEINNTGDSFYIATDVNTVDKTIEINQINSLGFSNYTSGGVVEFGTPVNLTDYSARMQIRESVDSETVIHSATTDNGEIDLNNTFKTITITIPASATAAFNFSTAVYSVELYTPNGKVVPFLTGNLTLVPEVTR